MESLADTLRAHGIDTATLSKLREGSGSDLQAFTLDGSKVVDLWHRLRALSEKTGYWPAILGDKDDMSILLDNLADATADSVQETLSQAAELDCAAWFKARRKDLIDDSGEDYLSELEAGEWPTEADVMTTFTIPTQIMSGKPKPGVKLALLPTKHSWEVPAWLNYGSWNECPGAAVHVSVLKHWNEKYGAELVGISGDVIELQVSRKPPSREAALQLAWEQCLYCEDIVTQGVGSIEALAAGLLDGNIWYFWWD